MRAGPVPKPKSRMALDAARHLKTTTRAGAPEAWFEASDMDHVAAQRSRDRVNFIVAKAGGLVLSSNMRAGCGATASAGQHRRRAALRGLSADPLPPLPQFVVAVAAVDFGPLPASAGQCARLQCCH